MKQILHNLLALVILPGLMIPFSCTDIGGDGIGTIEYKGSMVPEDSAYLNPVWNFDLTDASVFLSSGPFYAMGTEKEWSPGIQYTVPVLTSNDLMNWSLVVQAQAFDEKPSWANGNLHSVTAFFSKSLGMYYLFYALGDAGMGVADAKTPQGPYRDYGNFVNKDSLGVASIADPFAYASGSSFYLFYSVPDDGVYGVKLRIRKNVMPSLEGSSFKIAGKDISGVHIRKKDDDFWIFATRESSVVMARATNINGPYTDQQGLDLMSGGGTTVVSATSDFNLLGQVAGVQTDGQDQDWILYTAIDSKIPLLPSGEKRYVLMLNKLDSDGSGWPVEVIEARSGYCYPKFKI